MTGHYATGGLSSHFATMPIYGQTGKRIGTRKISLDDLLADNSLQDGKGYRWRNMSCFRQFLYERKKRAKL